MTHIQNELIDEACGRVIKRIEERGWGENTDVFFTTDHGELQGDYGLMFKGPYHCDSLMRIPLIWRPAPSSGVTPAEVQDPVGQVDLAPTFCEIAGIPTPGWVQGKPLPTAPGSAPHERMITEWDSQFPTYGMHLRTIYRDGYSCTVYERSTREPNGLTADKIPLPKFRMPETDIFYEGTEGELYKNADDPYQWYNLWGDPKYESIKRDLIEDLYRNMPAQRETLLPVETPA
jgi:arylsulfatase A-like enzyme